MATLRAVLERMWARPDSEVPEWVLTAKRSNRTVESIDVEFRASRYLRSWFATPVLQRSGVPVPLLSVDEANRRTVAALGRRIAAEKRRDDLRRRLYPTKQELEQEREAKRHRENLAAARRLGRELLGDE